MSTKLGPQKSGLNRREFIGGTAVATVGLVAGVHKLGAADSTPKPLNFNPDMEYRPAGQDRPPDLGRLPRGHWKRIDTVVPGAAALIIPISRRTVTTLLATASSVGLITSMRALARK